MTMRDLVLQAGGLHERALLTEAELARIPSNRSGGTLAVTTRVPLDSSYLFERGPDGKYLGPPGVPAPAAKAAEVTLRAYDNVLILEQPDWDMPRMVALNGEVRLPGTYTLLNKTERLSDLLARAGGLTEQAYAAGIVFVRNRDQIGRIGVDLPRVIRNPRHRDNFQLEDVRAGARHRLVHPLRWRPDGKGRAGARVGGAAKRYSGELETSILGAELETHAAAGKHGASSAKGSCRQKGHAANRRLGGADPREPCGYRRRGGALGSAPTGALDSARIALAQA
jgi:hypothetical protein